VLSYVSGDLFQSPAQTLVNTVNTVGVMGKGIALQFKKTYPEMFEEYRRLCERGDIKIGTLFLYRTPHKLVLNFPTKTTWRKPSRPEYIAAGLRTLVENYDRMGMHSIAFPPLGCGNGELDFDHVVRPIMHRYLSALPIRVYVYAPHARTQVPEHRKQAEIREWLRAEPRDLPFSEVWSDLRALVGAGREFETVARGTTYYAELVEDGDALRIRATGRTTTIARKEFQDLWQQLRSFGYLFREGLPANRERDASFVFPLLAELPYVRIVTGGQDYEAFNWNPTWGVQLVPPSQSLQPQLELIS
jgi:O-acetyl-ADP-ribose deacetylase (regulator of RNase III)